MIERIKILLGIVLVEATAVMKMELTTVTTTMGATYTCSAATMTGDAMCARIVSEARRVGGLRT
jgi:hypothetical protein